MGVYQTRSPIIMKTFCILSCLLAVTISSPVISNQRLVDCSAADSYVDEILANVATLIKEQGLDPAELPSGEVHFSQNIGFITVHGHAGYNQGHLDGLSTLHRTGGTELCVTDNIVVKANIGLRNAKAGYHVEAEFMGVTVGASADATISSVDIYFEAAMALTGDTGLTLTVFEITNIGHIDVGIHGLGPLDWILGTLVGGIADTIKGWIIPLIEGPIKDILQDIINGMMPPTALIA